MPIPLSSKRAAKGFAMAEYAIILGVLALAVITAANNQDLKLGVRKLFLHTVNGGEESIFIKSYGNTF